MAAWCQRLQRLRGLERLGRAMARHLSELCVELAFLAWLSLSGASRLACAHAAHQQSAQQAGRAVRAAAPRAALVAPEERWLLRAVLGQWRLDAGTRRRSVWLCGVVDFAAARAATAGLLGACLFRWHSLTNRFEARVKADRAAQRAQRQRQRALVWRVMAVPCCLAHTSHRRGTCR